MPRIGLVTETCMMVWIQILIPLICYTCHLSNPVKIPQAFPCHVASNSPAIRLMSVECQCQAIVGRLWNVSRNHRRSHPLLASELSSQTGVMRSWNWLPWRASCVTFTLTTIEAQFAWLSTLASDVASTTSLASAWLPVPTTLLLWNWWVAQR